MASEHSSFHSVGLSSETLDQLCSICVKTGRQVEATKTCLDCIQTLCDGCLMDHNKFDAMKGHRIVHKAMSVRGQVSLPIKMCDEHRGKLIDMYCPQHDRVCCTACVAIHHRQCEDISYIPSVSEGTVEGKELQEVTHNVKVALEDLQHWKAEKWDDLKRISEEKTKAEQNIKKYASRLIDAVNILKQKSLDQIQSKFNVLKEELDNVIEKINDSIAAMEENLKELQTKSSDNESQLFVSMKHGKELREMGNRTVAKTKINLKGDAILFRVDQKIENYLKKMDSLVELDTVVTSSLELCKSNMRVDSDQNQCRIYGICPLKNGSILVTDLENEKLKRLDSTYHLIDHCQLPGRPLCICVIGPTEVAITLGRQKMVQFVSVTDKLTPTRSFRVGEVCRGIAYSRGQLFITCGGIKNSNEGPGQVFVCSIDGSLLHKLPRQSARVQVWTYPYRVGLSHDDRRIIVADGKLGVVSMNKKGGNMTTQSLDVGSLCVNDQLLWFFGGNTTKAVYQMNSDMSEASILLTENDGIDNVPSAVCYQAESNRLIVGFDNDYIKVFTLYRK